MRKFQFELKAKGHEVYYQKLEKRPHFFQCLKKLCEKLKVTALSIYEIEDKFFEAKIKEFVEKHNLELEVLESPMFLVSREEFAKYNSSSKKPFMKTFYEGFRKTTGILMEANGQPTGGKFSFDAENRKKIPKSFDVIESDERPRRDEIIDSVVKVVEKYFSKHPGNSSDFWMRTSRKEALSLLSNFIKTKFQYFGDFEDAIDNRDPFLYHSVLSPYLNIGFITPEEIIKKTLIADVSINSKEGLVRQIIGWREFVHGIYREYSEVQDERNFFNHKRKLTKNWYEGSTGIVPLDDAIKKVIKYGYGHHIERLMIISNLMLLCRIDPSEVHKWFMEMYVDSSDWVMGPNVYGMAQFSDGGIFATKPYISGSNYILKMSHYQKGDWCKVWDGLYWMFIRDNKDFFKKNYRMSMMVKMLEKMDPLKQRKLFELANDFISVTTKK
jgi:deoxyribodipyrimidine photolyase-related protein